MEFDINVCKGLNGNILIEDYSLEFGRYSEEFKEGMYIYNLSVTINIVEKKTTENSKIVDVKIHYHDQLIEDPTDDSKTIYDLEKTEILLKEDGYYIIHHIVLPTTEFIAKNIGYAINNISYYFDNFNNIVRNFKNNDNPVSFNELINVEDSEIEKCTLDVFYTGFLLDCYINYCKKIFTNLTKNCNRICDFNDDITYIRDFLWMVLNIIDYQINFNQYIESQRLLELVYSCNGFCNNYKNDGCGCS